MVPAGCCFGSMWIWRPGSQSRQPWWWRAPPVASSGPSMAALMYLCMYVLHQYQSYTQYHVSTIVKDVWVLRKCENTNWVVDASGQKYVCMYVCILGYGCKYKRYHGYQGILSSSMIYARIHVQYVCTVCMYGEKPSMPMRQPGVYVTRAIICLLKMALRLDCEVMLSSVPEISSIM